MEVTSDEAYEILGFPSTQEIRVDKSQKAIPVLLNTLSHHGVKFLGKLWSKRNIYSVKKSRINLNVKEI